MPPGRVTALASASLGVAAPAASGGGQRTSAVLLATTAAGALCRLRLALPRTPGSGPGDVDLLGLGTDCAGTDLLPWVWPGGCGEEGGGVGGGGPALTAVDATGADGGGPPTAAVAGANGSIHLVRLGGDASARPESLTTRVAPPRPGVSLSAVRFVGGGPAATLLAAGTSGLELWDGRAGHSSSSARPACRVGAADGGRAAWPFPTGRPACLATHPARHHLIAAGGPGGVVAFWDLRGGSASLGNGPLASTAAPSGADVWDVSFDPAAAAGPSPTALFASDAGELGIARLDEGAGTATASVLYRDPGGAAVALDAAGPDACVATDAECLVFVRRCRL